jgi:hypothetical protein
LSEGREVIVERGFFRDFGFQTVRPIKTPNVSFRSGEI